jgi:hypothetical protein
MVTALICFTFGPPSPRRVADVTRFFNF